MSTGHTQTITFGGWYQRTTLHLSEVYDFLSRGTSRLPLSSAKLKQLHHDLHMQEVSREVSYFEYVQAITKDGIRIRYYEDGLYILELDHDDINAGKEKLEHYFNQVFQPAITYLFSLGAPTPKILANIHTAHPVVISVATAKPDDYHFDEIKFGEVYSKITHKNATVFKTHSYIFIVTTKDLDSIREGLVEMQIFFREFKDQLEKYLNIHRAIWEKISDIKERKTIRGNEVELLRTELDSYQKTISLISNRINQMGPYARTRSAISQKLGLDDDIAALFQFKYESLFDTLEYIKEVWRMTTDYINQAIQVMVELRGQALNADVTSLRSITTIGVITGVIGYMTASQLPKITNVGVKYFVMLLVLTAIINFVVTATYRLRTYKLSFTDNKTKL